MMNPETVLEILGELRVLRFFPNDEAVMNAIVRLCGSMCASEQQVRWLVDRMTSGIYAEWPGIAEMRACFCNRYKPADGINAYSSVYPDGLPPDPTAPRQRIAAPTLKALPPGHAATADPELEASIRQLAAKCEMPAKPAKFDRRRKSIARSRSRPNSRGEAPRTLNPNHLSEGEKARRLAELEASSKTWRQP